MLVPAYPDDPRPQFGPAFIASRSRAVRVAEPECHLHEEPDGHTLYVVPKGRCGDGGR